VCCVTTQQGGVLNIHSQRSSFVLLCIHFFTLVQALMQEETYMDVLDKMESIMADTSKHSTPPATNSPPPRRALSSSSKVAQTQAALLKRVSGGSADQKNKQTHDANKQTNTTADQQEENGSVTSGAPDDTSSVRSSTTSPSSVNRPAKRTSDRVQALMQTFNKDV
jgi:hypothetical protein